jgi:peptidoglycan hydrolase-like protein with peptidoglycan-binding domain
MTTYRIGSKGDEVKKLQQTLLDKGFDPGGIDGIYGPKTESAVKAYQKANNFTVDGIAGVQTLGGLYGTTTPPITNTQTVDTPIAETVPTITSTTANTNQTANNVPDISGLVGLRDYGTGKGLDIGWTKETGPTVNGNPINTTGMVNKDGKYYADISHLNSVFAPFEEEKNKPAPYVDPYAEKVNALLEQYLTQEPFQYNPYADPNFAYYSGMYTRAGDTAFQDTIGDLSSLTGGRVNSWATAAASQARNKYMQDLTNIIPTLEEKAYNRHMDSYNNILNQIQTLQGLGNESYGRYRDTVGDFQVDRNYNRGVLESDRNYNRGVLESDRAFDRNALESDRAFDYQASRDNILDDRWMKQFDYQQQQDIINNAIQNRQISVSEGNAALNRAEFEYRKEQDKLNRKTDDEIQDNRVELAITEISKLGLTGQGAIDWVGNNAAILGVNAVNQVLAFLELTGKINKTQAEAAKAQAEADMFN